MTATMHGTAAQEEYAQIFAGHGPTADEVWRNLSKASFLVLAFTNAEGRPRSSGLIYGCSGHRIYVQVHPGSLKAREIRDGQEVAVTVPVRRGGLLSLVMPIPPAAVSFHARVVVHSPGTLDLATVSKTFGALPEAMRQTAVVFELVPEGKFLTFGIGVSLGDMRDPAKALAHAPVA